MGITPGIFTLCYTVPKYSTNVQYLCAIPIYSIYIQYQCTVPIYSTCVQYLCTVFHISVTVRCYSGVINDSARSPHTTNPDKLT